MGITPSEAITAAFRAAEVELARGGGGCDYDEWIQSMHHHLRMAGRTYTQVALSRPTSDPPAMAILEHQAYVAALRVAVVALLTLGNFPVLRRITEPCPGEKLS